MFKNPFILKLGSFLPQRAGYSREYPFDYTEIQIAEDFTLQKFKGLVVVTRSQQGLLLQGQFSGELELECVRCLSSYAHFLEWDFAELYIFNRRDANENDLILPDNAQIDISEIVKEEAQLDIPINPICKEDCQGLCQICGANLNLGDCGHEELPDTENLNKQEHSPFAGLKDLF